MELWEVLRKPIVTEKSTQLQAQNKYVFAVATDANKAQIKQAVEKAFDVTVKAVNVISVHGKMRRMGRHAGHQSDWKKAVVTLLPGQKIEFFEGV